jgi:hypothetical protein
VDEPAEPTPEPIINRYEFVIIAEAEVIKAADVQASTVEE